MEIKRSDNTVLLVLRRHIQSIRVFFQNTNVSVDIDTSDGYCNVHKIIYHRKILDTTALKYDTVPHYKRYQMADSYTDHIPMEIRTRSHKDVITHVQMPQPYDDIFNAIWKTMVLNAYTSKHEMLHHRPPTSGFHRKPCSKAWVEYVCTFDTYYKSDKYQYYQLPVLYIWR